MIFRNCTRLLRSWRARVGRFRRTPWIVLKRLRLLDVIENTPPITEISGEADSPIPHVGADWLSMGGNVAHTGHTTEPGPRLGKLAWKHPVGWPWKAAAFIDSDRVYLTTPALDTALLCLDRRTGQEIWAAENPHVGFSRQSRASSTVIDLGDGELGLSKDGFDGWVISYLVIGEQEGRLRRRIPARPQETRNEPPELQPQQLVAHRSKQGTEVLVKSLKNGRTWWRFSTGYLGSEPIMKHGFVYAAGEDGTLWALNLWGSDRIAWTYRDDGSFAAPPSLLNGMLYVGDNEGMIHALEAASGKLHWKTKVASADSRSRQLFSRRHGHQRSSLCWCG